MIVAHVAAPGVGGGIVGQLGCEDQDSKNRLISVKIRENAEKYTLQSNKPLQLTDSEIYSLREEMRAALEGMEKLELDRQRANALALAEAPDSGQAGPDPDGLAPGSDR